MSWGSDWGTNWGGGSNNAIEVALSVIFSNNADLSFSLIKVATLNVDFAGTAIMTSSFANNIINLNIIYDLSAKLFSIIRENEIGPNPIIPPKGILEPNTVVPPRMFAIIPNTAIPPRRTLIPRIITQKKK